MTELKEIVEIALKGKIFTHTDFFCERSGQEYKIISISDGSDEMFAEIQWKKRYKLDIELDHLRNDSLVK